MKTRAVKGRLKNSVYGSYTHFPASGYNQSGRLDQVCLLASSNAAVSDPEVWMLN